MGAPGGGAMPLALMPPLISENEAPLQKAAAGSSGRGGGGRGEE